eukprot:COSAG01_NODE_6370_length_3707_cov_25.079545_1_plen_125_part_00
MLRKDGTRCRADETGDDAGGSLGFARAILFGIRQLVERVEGICDQVTITPQTDIEALQQEITSVFVRLRHSGNVSDRDLEAMLSLISRMKHVALLGMDPSKRILRACSRQRASPAPRADDASAA